MTSESTTSLLILLSCGCMWLHHVMLQVFTEGSRWASLVLFSAYGVKVLPLAAWTLTQLTNLMMKASWWWGSVSGCLNDSSWVCIARCAAAAGLKQTGCSVGGPVVVNLMWGLRRGASPARRTSPHASQGFERQQLGCDFLSLASWIYANVTLWPLFTIPQVLLWSSYHKR